MADPDHRIAKQIRAARAYAGLSRQQVGDALGMSPYTIGNWERGEWKDQPPRLPMIEAISRICGIPDLWVAVGFLAEPEEISPLEAQIRLEALLSRLSTGPSGSQSEQAPGQGDQEAGG
jgi:transcriptional regulator with XRE-family HTH domain